MPFPKDEATPPVIKMYLVDDAIRMGSMKFCLAFLWGTKLAKFIDFLADGRINIPSSAWGTQVVFRDLFKNEATNPFSVLILRENQAKRWTSKRLSNYYGTKDAFL